MFHWPECLRLVPPDSSAERAFGIPDFYLALPLETGSLPIQESVAIVTIVLATKALYPHRRKFQKVCKHIFFIRTMFLRATLFYN